MIDGTRFPVNEAPVHIRRRRDPVDVDHVVFPLDTAGLAVAFVTGLVSMSVAVTVMRVLTLCAVGSVLMPLVVCVLVTVAMVGVSPVP